MTTQITTTYTPEEFKRLLRKEVERVLYEMQHEQKPVAELSVREAARRKGCSVTTFNKRFAGLKRYDGERVYVLEGDLI